RSRVRIPPSTPTEPQRRPEGGGGERMTEGNLPPPAAAANPQTSTGPATRRHSLQLKSPSGLPPWAFPLALAVVPAVLVGLIVFFLARGSSGGGSDAGLAASVVDGFL